MSIAQAPITNRRAHAVHDARHLPKLTEAAIAEVTAVIAPVWPLQDYVAVNPYAGISQRSFMDARAFMKVFSDCESLMAIEHYATAFCQGRFKVEDIEAAIEELAVGGVSLSLSAVQIAENLNALGVVRSTPDRSAVPNHDRPVRTIADYATAQGRVDWAEAIVEEVSKHCAAHYDQGQSLWRSPFSELSLYEAWRTTAAHDYNIEVLGLRGFRSFVAELPSGPEAAIEQLLRRLYVPVHLWSTFLLCQAFSIPGWSAWAKYKTNWTDTQGLENNDLVGLLAMRLAYDAALAEAKALRLNWASLADRDLVSFQSPWVATGDDSMLRYTLLRASEIGFRSGLLSSLTHATELLNNAVSSKQSARKLAQMVFCIDVRSERMRRQLETQSEEIETFGFAGFFGMAFEYVALGESSGKSQLPVLLKPQFRVLESLEAASSAGEEQAINQRQFRRTWASMWKSFQCSAVGCFSFVETIGLSYGLRLLGRAFGLNARLAKVQFPERQLNGKSSREPDRLGPTLRGLEQQGVTAVRQADMAEGILRGIGMVKDFARLVVLCGHGCQTENNPLAAGLDCGACGGHSGEPNARFAALLLNQPHIRQALAARGIHIPADTHFLAALHNTTTDAIGFFDADRVPAEHQAALQELVSYSADASKQTQIERLPSLANNSVEALLKRASDWSEVRPEWGLAGNAAFIVAPRALTKNVNLDARCFLHSYDYRQDDAGKVLEAIMTAPMIVANWINMQYYASSVDNHYFGSGNKTIHNVVGRFGILSGSGGDLQTGLPWQSVHTGEFFQHLPMRLQVVIAAPRAMIDRVIAKHQWVANLIGGTWLHLVGIEDGQAYRCSSGGTWEHLPAVG